MAFNMLLKSLGRRRFYLAFVLASLLVFGHNFFYGSAFAATFVPKVPVFPLSELKPGMQGEVVTVVKGLERVSFPAEVVSIIPSQSEPKSLILIRAKGTLVEKIGGIAAGMSGSPFFIGGKLVGAIGYGWEFSDHNLGLVTPIEEMAKALERSSEANGVVKHGFYEGKNAPMIASGVSRRGAERISDDLKGRAEVLPFDLPQGGISVDYSAKLNPGDSVGVLLAWGDVTVGATGTLTALDDEGNFLAFAHPFLNRGDVSFPLTRSWVHEVIPSIRSPFKLGSPLSIVGVVNQDRPQAIAGRVRSFPHGVEVSVKFTDESGKSTSKRFQVVNDPFLMNRVLPGALLGLLDDLWGRVGEGTGYVSVKIEGKGFTEGFSRKNVYFSDNDIIGQIVNQEIMRLVSSLSLNRFKEIEPMGIHVELQVTRKPEIVYIEKLEIPNKDEVKKGQDLDVQVTLRNFRGEPEVKKLILKVPEKATGLCEVVVRGGGIAEPSQVSLMSGWRAITSFDEFLNEIKAEESNNQVIVELLYGSLLEEEEGGGISLDENYELVSEMKKRRMEEGTLKVFDTNYYVEGLLRRTVTIQDSEGN
ncbi:SpoIVB peptidase S55 domain-containing protein [Acetomicrobium hydrogeniformans]|uniref:Peptidase S55 n=1 Tax=Acetomicrobium hydrogeniformans TaxID=649746 RepID=A0A7V6ZFR7_9BACT|nr:SpoIVB peptidase S55 domain-containing protein [Acetomicrobium hydrogeniformans]HHZ05132.1 peptidase S55 [Acetomicrobium hydrogeniformans]